MRLLTGIFEDDQVTHIEGDVDPVRDMEIIHEELRLKDLEYLDRTVDNMERVVVRGGDKSRKAEYVRCFSDSVCLHCVSLHCVTKFIAPSLQINRMTMHGSVSWWDKQAAKTTLNKPHLHWDDVKSVIK